VSKPLTTNPIANQLQFYAYNCVSAFLAFAKRPKNIRFG